MTGVWQKKFVESSKKCRRDEKKEERSKEREKLSTEPVPSRRPFQPIQQQGQLFGPQTAAGALPLRPAKRALLQTLGADPQPASIEQEYLNPVMTAIGEQKEMAGQRVLSQHALHARREPVETLAQVHWLQGHEDAVGGRQTQHPWRTAFITASIHEASARAPKRTVTPLGQVTSAAHRPLGHSGDTAISRNAAPDRFCFGPRP